MKSFLVLLVFSLILAPSAFANSDLETAPTLAAPEMAPPTAATPKKATSGNSKSTSLGSAPRNSVGMTAEKALSPLTEKDLSVLNSGAACWLKSPKGEIFLQDDMSSGLVKLGARVVKLTRDSGKFDKGFFNCGQTYTYVVKGDGFHITVEMAKENKKGLCKGTVTLLGSRVKAQAKDLESDCGA